MTSPARFVLGLTRQAVERRKASASHCGAEQKRTRWVLMKSLRLLAVSAVLLAGGPQVASAYVCTQVTDNMGRPVSPTRTQVWQDRCIAYVINRNNALLSGVERRTLLAESFGVWSEPNCTDLNFLDLGYTNETAGFDGNRSNKNVIWAVETAPEVAMVFTSERQVAITETFFSVESGEIFNADLSINAVGFRFEDVTDEVTCRVDTDPPFDLRSILIHEIGHFIGFDHESDMESTMFFSAEACETKKRSLTPDDVMGVCDVYPLGQPTNTCSPPLTSSYSINGGEQVLVGWPSG